MLQKTWRSMSLTLAIVALLALAAGCGTAAPVSSPTAAGVAAAAETAVDRVMATNPLAMTAWDLDYFGSPEAPIPVLPDTRASVVYFWDRYAGFDGCSFFVGVYSATDEGMLSMYGPARTLYANQCAPMELNAQAAKYNSSLVNVIDYKLEGGQLIANAIEDQRLLTYNPARPVPMVGTDWQLAFYWQPDLRQFNPVLPASTTTIAFTPGGQASGSGGCNDYSASYQGDVQSEKVLAATDTYQDLPTLTFGPVAAQQAACGDPEGIMEQEQAYFAALGSVAYYLKLGGMLMMVDAEGMPLFVFSAGE
jgi:heat shock protein HslJ